MFSKAIEVLTDTSFWLGVIVTTMLSIPAGVAAISLHKRMFDFLDSRRTTTHQKRIKQASQFYKIIQDLRSRRRDKYVYLLHGISIIICCFITSVVFIVGAFVIFALDPDPLRPNQIVPANFNQWHRLGIAIGFLFLSAFIAYIGEISVRRFLDVRNVLEDFEGYERDFISKWGEPPKQLKDPE